MKLALANLVLENSNLTAEASDLRRRLALQESAAGRDVAELMRWLLGQLRGEAVEYKNGTQGMKKDKQKSAGGKRSLFIILFPLEKQK